MRPYETQTMNERLNFLARRNKGKYLSDEVAKRFALGLELSPSGIDFLDLEQTDVLREKFSLRLGEVGKSLGDLDLGTEDWAETQSTINQIGGALPEMEVVLINSEAKYTGAIRASLHRVLDHASSLIELDGEDLLMSARDASFGLLLEYSREFIGEDWKNWYRLRAWGIQRFEDRFQLRPESPP